MLPYLALALYIISLIISLILMITSKKKEGQHHEDGQRGFRLAMIIHLIFLVLFLVSHSMRPNHQNVTSILSFSFLFYFCSGTALCGWAVRMAVPLLLKIYFVLFNASLLVFILMPFNFSVFLLSGGFIQSNETKFRINDRYYITEQGSILQHSAVPIYRVVKLSGMFNQTVQYNLSFGAPLDSIHVKNIINDKSAVIRAYFKNAVRNNISDSSDVEIKLKLKGKNEIQRNI